jgi:hypothetical protein
MWFLNSSSRRIIPYGMKAMRENVKLTSMFMRVFFLCSLFVIGGLVIAAMITVVIGLNITYSDAISLSLINRVRFRSQQIVTDSLVILNSPDNTTVLHATASDLVSAGQLNDVSPGRFTSRQFVRRLDEPHSQ